MRTLENGLKRIDDIMNASKETLVDGAKAFELYDTFGFPIDLTALILSENGKEVDMEGFDVEMKKQKSVLVLHLLLKLRIGLTCLKRKQYF